MNRSSSSTSGVRPVTMKDIATRCGVTTATVSLALRNDTRISAATIQRVLAVSEELGYDPSHNQAARRMIMRRYGREVINRVVAVFFPRHFYKANYFAHLLEGILDTLTAQEFTLVVAYPGESASDAPAPLPSIFSHGEVDGALLFGGMTLAAQLQQTAGFRQRPAVSLINTLPALPAVTADDEGGAYLAAHHLLDLGHRYFVHFYTPSSGEVYLHRLRGLQRALRERGLDPDQHAYMAAWYLGNITPPHHLDMTASDAQPAIKHDQQDFVRFMREHPQYTAVLAPNDANARRAWYLLKQAGLRIPQDISLIGFDDTDPIPDEHGVDILTSVHLPLVEIGSTAADIVIQRILNRESREESVILPASLTVRGTTGPVRG